MIYPSPEKICKAMILFDSVLSRVPASSTRDLKARKGKTAEHISYMFEFFVFTKFSHGPLMISEMPKELPHFHHSKDGVYAISMYYSSWGLHKFSAFAALRPQPSQ